jgi:hypothetical protein
MDAVLGVWALEYSRKGDPNHGMFSESIILGELQERLGSFFGRRRMAHIRKIRTFAACWWIYFTIRNKAETVFHFKGKI